MAYLSECGTTLDYNVTPSPLRVGDVYNVPNSNYTIEQISIDCSNGFNSIAVLRVLKNGIEIGRDNYSNLGPNTYSYDNGNLCIKLRYYYCTTPPYDITYELWYNGIYQPTHILKLQIADSFGDYVGYIAQGITDISTKLATAIAPNPDIHYIKTEYNSIDNTLDIYVAYTGTGLSIPNTRMTTPYATIPGEFTLFDWAIIIIPIISLVIVGIVFVLILAGFTIGIGLAIVTVLLFGFSVYWLYYLGTNNISQQKVVQNLTQKQQGDAALDATEAELAKLFQQGKITCVQYITSLRDAVVSYANKKKADFSLIQIDTEFNTYKTCTNNVINSIGSDCSIPLASMTVCKNPLMLKIDAEIGLKYGPGEPFLQPSCSTQLLSETCNATGTCIWYYGTCIDKKDCLLVEPVNKTCILKTGDIILGAGIGLVAIAGLIYVPPILGKVMSNIEGMIPKEETKTERIEYKPKTKTKHR